MSVAGNSLWSASLACALILALVLGIFSAMQMPSVNAQTKINDVKGRKMAVGFVSLPPVDRMENPPKDAGDLFSPEKLRIRADEFCTRTAIRRARKSSAL
jgi:hypothetical protein